MRRSDYLYTTKSVNLAKDLHIGQDIILNEDCSACIDRASCNLNQRQYSAEKRGSTVYLHAGQYRYAFQLFV